MLGLKSFRTATSPNGGIHLYVIWISRLISKLTENYYSIFLLSYFRIKTLEGISIKIVCVCTWNKKKRSM